jgi:hypothetical protein
MPHAYLGRQQAIPNSNQGNEPTCRKTPILLSDMHKHMQPLFCLHNLTILFKFKPPFLRAVDARTATRFAFVAVRLLL